MNISLRTILITAVLCSVPLSVSAQEDKRPLLTESQYFSVYGYDGIDVNELLAKLNFTYFLHVDMLREHQASDLKSILTRTMDALYQETSDILGIHIYNFHGSIVFYPDQPSLARAFREYFGEDFPERSYYRADKNTIYISFDDLTLGMIGHEIAHAIISHYFVVPPPSRVQEILCGYVEYTLRKDSGTLP